MGSKKHKKESRKRKHHSRSASKSPEREEKERRKHKKRHHKDRKREKHLLSKKEKSESSSNSDDDVIYVPPPPKISKESSPTPPPPPQITAPRSPSPPPPPTIAATAAPPAAGAEKTLSIDETNALRAKLGLKPLAVASSDPPPAKSRPSNVILCPETNVEFVHKPAESLTQKKLSEKLRHKITERKEKRQYEKKLSAIKSLGAESEDEDSAAHWVKKSRKQEEERLKALLKAKELDEMDEVFGIGDLVEEEIKKEKISAYTGADLRGLKVEHDVETFTEGKSVILTLKDKGVLEDEDDALINVNMVDDERYKKNVQIKKKINKPFGYNAVDNGDLDDEGPEGVLSKYDEEIEGAKKSSFKLGESSSQKTKMKLKHLLHEDKKMTLVSLNTTEMKLANDYLTPDEIKIKKPKKKKKIRSRVLKPEDLIDIPEETTQRSRNVERGVSNGAGIKVESEDPMDIDGIPSIPVLGLDGIKIEEEPDNELELALKKARRLKQMPTEARVKLPKIEEVIREVKEEPEDDAGLSSIVLNSTAEFCRTLGDIPTYGMAGNRDEEPDILMDFEREKEFKKKKQEEFEDRGGWNDVEMDEKLVETKQIEGTILDAEPDLGAGVAGALRLAVSKGYLEKETTSRPSASRFSHLAAQNYSIDDKAHTAEDEKVGRRERYLGPTMDFKEKESYKPNIKLEYIDDDGHLLCAKEAFRYLSHKFHGKGPGKNKVEKRMKKNEQEVLMKQMSSSDTPLGTLQMLQHKQKETQSAFVVLSGSKALTTPASISKTKMSK